jgi:hypothetical protein
MLSSSRAFYDNMATLQQLEDQGDAVMATKRKSRSISDDISDIATKSNSRSLVEGRRASTRLPRPEAETPIASVRIDLPEYVDRQLKLKCVMDGGAKAYYILKALARDGFEINKEDLRLDRRRRKKFR